MSKTNKEPDKIKLPSCTERLVAVGIDAICERIGEGEADGEIAKSLGMSRMSLNNWLNLEENIIISARAREQSAESWLDKGLETISTALPKDGGVDASAARAYAQECARRAAIRNPKYRDRNETAITGADGGPIKVESLTDEEIARKLYMALAITASKIPDEITNK